MKAWILKESTLIEEKSLELAQWPLPVPAADEVLIRVMTCGAID